MLGAFRWYNRKLTEKPLLVKSSTSASVMATADYLSQRIKSSQAGVAQARRDFEWNARQTIWMAIYGATFVAPFCHHWYKVITFFYSLPFFFFPLLGPDTFTQHCHQNGDSKAKLSLFCSFFSSLLLSLSLSPLFLSLEDLWRNITPFVVSRATADLLLLVPHTIACTCRSVTGVHLICMLTFYLSLPSLPFIWHTGQCHFRGFFRFSTLFRFSFSNSHLFLYST